MNHVFGYVPVGRLNERPREFNALDDDIAHAQILFHFWFYANLAIFFSNVGCGGFRVI